MLEGKTQTLALQAFLLERGTCYQSLSLEGLCEMFSLPADRVRAEVNRLLLPAAAAGTGERVLE